MSSETSSKLMMKGDNVIQIKSYAFAIRIVRLYQHLSSTKKEFVLSKQLLRSGTSVGANIEEAIAAHSRADFIAKVTVSHKEIRETIYWLRILKDTDYLTATEFTSINNDALEVANIIGAILKTTKTKSTKEI